VVVEGAKTFFFFFHKFNVTYLLGEMISLRLDLGPKGVKKPMQRVVTPPSLAKRLLVTHMMTLTDVLVRRAKRK
jgi:hypothetical protein